MNEYFSMIIIFDELPQIEALDLPWISGSIWWQQEINLSNGPCRVESYSCRITQEIDN